MHIGKGHYERKCRTCGKKFLPASSDYAYKFNKANVDYYFCSWKCIQQWRREHEKPPRKPKEVSRAAEVAALADGGMAFSDIAAKLGIKESTARSYWQKRTGNDMEE